MVRLRLDRLQRRRRLFRSRHHFDLPAPRPVRPAGRREGLIWTASRRAGASTPPRAFKDAGLTDADRFRAVAAAGRFSDRHRCPQRTDPADALSAAVGADRGRRHRPACYSLSISPWLEARAARPVAAALPTQFDWRSLAGQWFIPFAIGFVIVYPIIVLAVNGRDGSVTWIDNFGIQILIYVMLGWGLNIVVGLAGLLDLGYVAFYAVGAYSYALLPRPSGFVLDPVAARGLSVFVLGAPARLSGVAAARRLSRHRHARLRRDHPHGADQLGGADQRLCRHQRHSAADFLRHSVQCR